MIRSPVQPGKLHVCSEIPELPWGQQLAIRYGLPEWKLWCPILIFWGLLWHVTLIFVTVLSVAGDGAYPYCERQFKVIHLCTLKWPLVKNVLDMMVAPQDYNRDGLEMAQHWEHVLFLQRVWGWFPASMSGDSQMPATPFPVIECSLASEGTCKHVKCTNSHGHTHTHTFKKVMMWKWKIPIA